MNKRKILYNNIRLEGYIAGTGGKKKSDNPYCGPIAEKVAWNLGWEEAEQELEKGVEN